MLKASIFVHYDYHLMKIKNRKRYVQQICEKLGNYDFN